MSQTIQKGPFFIERGKNDSVAVRSKRPFSYAVYWKAHAEAQGALYAMPPLGLQAGMKLILSAVGEDDVVVDGGGAA